ncbi:type II toxin-antitoxin system RelE/ParE family toxin [Litorimonas haliclonae]|uniref:type II toxin-antitoxin system RelE/ParE family toxin n=1 Tax=Litorimonas haliclonae TaxID=2081977 RepID=UPI0039F0723E
MASYRLAKSADLDFEQIFEYGIDTFGVKTAVSYQNRLLKHFDELAKQPLLYQAVNDVRQGYRRSVCGVHAIYYRIDPEEIVIVRILGRQNPKSAFL